MTSIKRKRKRSLNSSPSSSNHNKLANENLPVHVAIIMDGNGRWAKKHFLNRIKGHEKGTETVRMVVETSREIGLSILTLYAFSTENWQRPKTEVAALMTLLKNFLESELANLMKNNIRLSAIGQIERLPPDVQQSLNRLITSTNKNDGMILNLALSYGGRAEIVRVVQKIAKMAQETKLDPGSITAEHVSEYLYTKGMPDPDLLIRTSGESRISNFLLWQIAYTEIFVTDTLWPDFGKEEFVNILKDFQCRDRRFGRVGA
ncbi:isoprenyl transferase [Thermodesulfobacteriota bacterium]